MEVAILVTFESADARLSTSIPEEVDNLNAQVLSRLSTGQPEACAVRVLGQVVHFHT